MSNSYSCVGNIVRDGELKDVGSTQLLEVTVANGVGFGERQTTNWINAKFWGKQASALSSHLTKGKKIFVSGELICRTYDKKDGGQGFSLDLDVKGFDFAGGKEEGGSGGGSAPAKEPETADDMPF